MRIKSKLKACAMAVTLAVMPLFSHSAGLGRLNVLSGLGQPLRAEIDLVAVQAAEIDSLKATLASPDDFRQAQIDYPTTSLGLRFSLEKRSNGQYYVSIISANSLNEPFLDFLVELKWDGGRVLREYTALLDPVGYSAGKQADVPVARPAQPAARAPVVDKPAAAPVVQPKPLPSREPVEKPAPKSEQPKPEPVKGESTYEVKAGDTLAGIAQRNARKGVSLEQMLVGLYRANPEAFDRKNMNRLLKGKILKIPGQEALLETPRAAAAEEVKVQADDWRSYRGKVADSALERPAKGDGNASSGKIKPKVEDKGAGAQTPSPGTLTISKGDDSKSLKEKILAREAEVAANKKALDEERSRVAELEKNNKKLQELIDLKSKALADAQSKASAKPDAKTPDAKPADAKAKELAAKEAAAKEAAAKEAAATAAKEAAAKDAAAKEAASKEAAAKDAAAKEAAAKEAAAKEAAAKEAAAKAAAPADAKPAEAAKPPVVEAPKPPADAPKKKPKVVEPPPPPPEESLLDDPMVLYGGGGLAALLLGAGAFMFMRRRKRSGFEDSIITGSDLKSNTVVGNTGGGVISTGVTENSFLTDFSREGLGTIDTDEVDPIAEAEVYMAYGRDAQAEEILKDALTRDSSRQEVRLKLLEIYSGRKNVAAFESVAKDLHNATQGQGLFWAQAADMGRILDPGNSLYSVAAPADMAGGDKTLVTSAGMAAGMVDTTRLSAPVFDAPTPSSTAAPIDLDFQLDAPETSASAAAIDESVDFDLGDSTQVSNFSAEPPKLDMETDAVPTTELDMDAGLDFPMSDFNLDAPAVKAMDFEAPPSEPASDMLSLDIPLGEPGMFGEPEPAKPAALADTPDHDMMDLSLDSNDFAMPDLNPPAHSTPEVAPALAMGDISGDMGEFEAPDLDNDSSLNFDFDLGQDGGKPAKADAAASAEPSFDLGDMNLDLDTPAEINMGGSDLDFDAELDDPVTTKIDLARAYIDMGDKEGAREILQEAISEGTPEQQATAESLLVKL